MKKFKKALVSILVIGVLGACLTVPAFASRYYLAGGVFDSKYSTETKSFDARPANKIRFIFTPKCSVSGARVQVELHRKGLISPVPDTQIHPVNQGEQRAWWYANPGSYHVQLHAQNNTLGSSKANIECVGVWFENYEGALGIQK